MPSIRVRYAAIRERVGGCGGSGLVERGLSRVAMWGLGNA
jgi:hypothetical protein